MRVACVQVNLEPFFFTSRKKKTFNHPSLGEFSKNLPLDAYKNWPQNDIYQNKNTSEGISTENRSAENLGILSFGTIFKYTSPVSNICYSYSLHVVPKQQNKNIKESFFIQSSLLFLIQVQFFAKYSVFVNLDLHSKSFNAVPLMFGVNEILSRVARDVDPSCGTSSWSLER